MHKYIFTNRAVNDLSSIWDYGFEVWSESQADKYYYILIDACQELANGKLSGKNYSDIRSDIFGYRVGQHIIFYRPLADSNIEIVRILHVRMDLKNRMQE